MAPSGTTSPADDAEFQLRMRAEINDWRADHPRYWGRRTFFGVARLAAFAVGAVIVLLVLGATLNVASDAMHVSKASAPRQH